MSLKAQIGNRRIAPVKLIVLVAALAVAAGAAAQPAAKFPGGVFRTTITDADLKAGGVKDIAQNHGTYTMTLRPGRWRFVQKAPNPLEIPVAGGGYTLAGNGIRFTIRTPAPLNGASVHGTWTYDGKALRFQGMREDPSAHVLFTAHPWRRIG